MRSFLKIHASFSHFQLFNSDQTCCKRQFLSPQTFDRFISSFTFNRSLFSSRARERKEDTTEIQKHVYILKIYEDIRKVFDEFSTIASLRFHIENKFRARKAVMYFFSRWYFAGKTLFYFLNLCKFCSRISDHESDESARSEFNGGCRLRVGFATRKDRTSAPGRE